MPVWACFYRHCFTVKYPRIYWVVISWSSTLCTPFTRSWRVWSSLLTERSDRNTSSKWREQHWVCLILASATMLPSELRSWLDQGANHAFEAHCHTHPHPPSKHELKLACLWASVPLHNSKEYGHANLAGGVVRVSMTGHASLPLPPEWIGVLPWNGKTKGWRRATQSVFSPLAYPHISSRSSWYSLWPEAATQYTNNLKLKVSMLSHSKKAVLIQVCMFSLCRYRLPLGTLTSSHHPNTCMLG